MKTPSKNRFFILTLSFVLGVFILAPNVQAQYGRTAIIAATTNSYSYFGQDGFNTKTIATLINSPRDFWFCSAINVQLKAVGSPTDGVKMNIYQGGSDYYSGSLLWQGQTAFQVRATSTWEDITYTFGSGCVAMRNNTNYWLVLDRTLSYSSMDYYAVKTGEGGTTTASYAFAGTTYNSRKCGADGNTCGSSFGGIYMYGEGLPATPGDISGIFNATSTLGDLSVDCGTGFTGGLCGLVTYLFVPDESVFQNWANLIEELQLRVPFSYVYEVQTTFSNVGTGTPQNLPSIILTTNSTSSIGSQNIALFSSSSLATVAAGTSVAGSGFTTLRTIENFVLYAMFGTMCYYTGIGLIRKK